MFCPKCSQEQASEEQRFCSRCGFQLNVVKALLANDAFPAGVEAKSVRRSFSKRDATIGATLMFLVALLIAIVTVGLPPAHTAPILLLFVAWPLLALLINIKPVLQYFLKADNVKDTSSDASTFPSFASDIRSRALPSSQSVPADVYIPRAADTADMTPHSVTEDTTNLLKDN